jgi:hypothetical protein
MNLTLSQAFRMFLVLLLCLFMPASAQYDPAVEQLYFFEANYTFELSSSAGAFTLKLPAASARPMVGYKALVCTDVEVTITQYLGGTATGGTAVTTSALNSTATPVTSVLRGATRADATQVGLTMTVAADTCSPPIDLSRIQFLKGAASDQVYSIVTSSVTGNVGVSTIFTERRR